MKAEPTIRADTDLHLDSIKLASIISGGISSFPFLQKLFSQKEGAKK